MEIWNRDKVEEDEDATKARELRIQARIARERAERAAKLSIKTEGDDGLNESPRVQDNQNDKDTSKSRGTTTTHQ
jgi:hypothetical protein